MKKAIINKKVMYIQYTKTLESVFPKIYPTTK